MKTATTPPLRFKPEEVQATPFPHIVKDGVIRPDLFRRLKAEFPANEVFDGNSTRGGRAGRDLYRGDAAYDELLNSSPAWKELHDYLNSQAYVDLGMELFGDHMGRFDCYTDPARVRFVEYVEPRDALAVRSRLRRKIDDWTMRFARPTRVNDIFVRMDLAQGDIGYGKEVHCDRPNRLVSMLVYFCDSDALDLEGGELLIHELIDKNKKPTDLRHPTLAETREIARLRPRENLGLIFLCTNNSYHSVREVHAQRGYRNFIYCSLTGMSRTLWPVR